MISENDNLYAVVGLGNISGRHRNNLKSIFPSGKVACMASSNKPINYMPQDCDVLANSIKELISLKPSFAIVASPATFHAQHSIPFIENNIPVLIEKPIAASIKDANLIAASAKKYKTSVAIGYCLRYKPFLDELKDVLDMETIGMINEVSIVCGSYLPSWRPGIDYRDSVSASAKLGGGALLELSHEIDYANFLINGLCLESAIIKNSKTLDIEVEDCADLIFTMGRGKRCKIHLDFLQKKPIRTATFKCNDGNIFWDLHKNSLHIASPYLEVNKMIDSWDSNNMYTDMLIDFSSNFIHDQESKLCNVSEALNVLTFIEEARQLGEIDLNE